VGGLLMKKKKKVDTLLFDYVNENGGLTGLILPAPKGEGEQCRQWLTRFGVKVEEPAPATPPDKK